MSRNERSNSFGPIGPADVGPTTTNNDEQQPTTDNRRVTSDE
ncbi:hypothetical protein BMA721280_L0636 [Burkholderia mallei 2002721280]|uniref:Uncharacterized protein n=1 Tax=Burkholderia mallei (strain NCTC 10229) TaxID=412022 RepID=A2RW05_BURM9|nr:hypothetical protein BMA10229_0048 [Burkholderia mallei NCTC 10229]ABN85770.1 hypothetical protein BURPS668_A0956 [Burkholderia pseudomallei 668]EDK83671.1 hypothetical protein BMA721280_L0636 [Burkholderia mallei 2002721280]EDP84526.1 hypothetical protein BMA10399_L0001 [Burkholderia mallei ATCC 10399]EEP50152.1 conserved hypothetical protein [Burkholderia pseudomallei MSHR346]EEP83739.1 conserved hypothetical protein [Burkholderia mallei GB8 horse 4]